MKKEQQNELIQRVMCCKFVRSNYRARWTGIVIDKENRTGNTPLYLILVVADRNGNMPRKRLIKTLDSAWTEQVDKFDLSYMPYEWLTNLPTL